MALYLVQHAHSLGKDQDPEKGISPEGTATTRRIAEVASAYGIRVTRIMHSGKKRARQTAELFADTLSPTEGVEAMDGINPLDDVASLAPSLDPSRNQMLVGHLPFMERLTAYLVTGDADCSVFQFQNAGIVCLDRSDDPRGWVIKWTLMPDIS